MTTSVQTHFFTDWKASRLGLRICGLAVNLLVELLLSWMTAAPTIIIGTEIGRLCLSTLRQQLRQKEQVPLAASIALQITVKSQRPLSYFQPLNHGIALARRRNIQVYPGAPARLGYFSSSHTV